MISPPLLSTARRFLITNLKATGIENNLQEADFILIRLLDCTRAEILAYPDKILTSEQWISIEKALKQRISGKPLQYILKEAFFWGRPFEVAEGVLIPRPETELLVELALEFLAPRPLPTFLDWCTGSGCIAATLLLERPDSRAVMAEKNPLSLVQAWKNLERYALHPRSFLWHSQTPSDIPVAKEECDLIVSNPPYIPSSKIPGLMREVRDHEPHLALDGGEDGMDCYRALFDIAPLWLKDGGVLLFEIGDEKQASTMRDMPWPHFVLARETRDYSGVTRCMAWRYLE